MSEVLTLPDLEEWLSHDIPCNCCGQPATHRSLGHPGCPWPTPVYKCRSHTREFNASRTAFLRVWGCLKCRGCHRRFGTLESFSDFREF